MTRDPIDLEHLRRQTMSDDALLREVLELFVNHTRKLVADMRAADTGQRRVMSHTLRGAASGVGAFALAEHAALMEARPKDETLLEPLELLAEEACAVATELYEGGGRAFRRG